MVIQGFGNVGGMAAKLMARAGFKIICIVEFDGAVHDPQGLDILALMKHRKKPVYCRFSGGQNMDREEPCS